MEKILKSGAGFPIFFGSSPNRVGKLTKYTMRDKELYAQILGIKSPWQVSDEELNVSSGEVTVIVEQDQEPKLCCPICGKLSPGYDSRTRRWRHLDTGPSW
jgi:hypothetical protein